MKIPIKDILELYKTIIDEVNIADVSALLFTALDVDSLCTVKILSVHML